MLTFLIKPDGAKTGLADMSLPHGGQLGMSYTKTITACMKDLQIPGGRRGGPNCQVQESVGGGGGDCGWGSAFILQTALPKKIIFLFKTVPVNRIIRVY